MTRSLGAELTGSSLIMMISSPGSSFPSDGPPAHTERGTDQTAPLMQTGGYEAVQQSNMQSGSVSADVPSGRLYSTTSMAEYSSVQVSDQNSASTLKE